MTSEEIVFSVEETNKIREKLGLPPLRIDSSSSNNNNNNNKNNKRNISEQDSRNYSSIDKEAERNGEESEGNVVSKAQLIKERIKESQEKRRYLQQVSVLSLGEKLKEEDEGVEAWIKKTRDLQIEKNLAQKKEQELFETEEQASNASTIASSRYSSRDLSGLTVAHDLKEVLDTAEEPIVLTLADEQILSSENGKYELNKEEPKLENINLSEKAKFAEYQERKKKKPVYNAFDDTKKNILSQYDDPKEKPQFVLDAATIANEQEQVRLKLEESGKRIESLEIEKKIASEYFTQEEMAKFKKKTGKKKERKIKQREDTTATEENNSTTTTTTTTTTITELTVENTQQSQSQNVNSNNNTNDSQDFGSREQRALLKERQNEERKMKLEQQYQKAVSKASDESRLLFEPEDKELVKEISSVRSAKQQKQNFTLAPENIAKQILNKQKTRDTEMSEQNNKDQNLVFTPISEFVRTIQPLDEILAKPKKSKKEKKQSEKTEDISMGNTITTEELEEREKLIREQAQLAREQKKMLKEKDKEFEIEKLVDTSNAQLLKNEKQQKQFEEKEEGEASSDEDENENDENGDTDSKDKKELEGSVTKQEVYVSNGMASTLLYLQQKGAKKEDRAVYVGRKNDWNSSAHLRQDPKGKEKENEDDPYSDLRLEYTDEKGRLLTPKEAFRQLSYKFHGKKPGKRKLEIRHKRYLEELKAKEITRNDTDMVDKMRKEQEKLQSPYLILSAKSNVIAPEAERLPKGKLAKSKPKSKPQDRNVKASTTKTENTGGFVPLLDIGGISSTQPQQQQSSSSTNLAPTSSAPTTSSQLSFEKFTIAGPKTKKQRIE